MTITLLLDLDDTLLFNPMGTFIPAYLQALSEHLKEHAHPDQIVKQLLYATSVTSQNKNPDCTLIEVFDSLFYPRLGWEQEEVRPDLDQFYAEIFPKLKQITKPRPGAQRLVDEALKRDYRLAIATNPLFPKTAIVQRLTWAGFSPDEYPLAIIPSIESFHFAKPEPAYLAELLAKIGWLEQPAIMIGDDPQNDVRPARDLGIPVYWTPVNEHHQPSNDYSAGKLQFIATGDISEFFTWLDSQDPQELKPNYDSPSALLAILRSTPAALDSLCSSNDNETWARRPQPDEWSQTEILCHLRDVDREVNLPRVQKVVSSVNPLITGQDTDPWALERDYISQDGSQALQAFINLRMKLINILSNLQVEDWQRPARHTILGPTHLQELVRIIASHDRIHIQQIISVIESIDLHLKLQ